MRVFETLMGMEEKSHSLFEFKAELKGHSYTHEPKNKYILLKH